MAKLTYSAIASLDGYIEDAEGSFAWAVPDEELHAYVNDQERGTGTHLLGRRMYEMMVYWDEPDPTRSPIAEDFAEIWRGAEKIVYSTTLETAPHARLEREFDPAAVRELKTTAERDLSISGPALAAHAFRAGLVDEVNLYLHPIVIGAGKPALPTDQRIGLRLLDERRFGSGVVHLRYAYEA